jgi:hypothetical protein
MSERDLQKATGIQSKISLHSCLHNVPVEQLPIDCATKTIEFDIPLQVGCYAAYL